MKTTYFAPAERASETKIKSDFDSLEKSEYIRTIINALPEVVAILNRERQIVFGNEALLKFLGIVDKETLLGLRPGEAVKCINSTLNDGGCGTSKNCKYCGAVNAIMESQMTMQKVTKECRITSKKDDKTEFLDLRVTSSPFMFKGTYYSILSIDDISDAKRRKMLEKIFFHDVINIAGGLKGITDILVATSNNNNGNEEYIKLVNKMGGELLEEIMSQRALSYAEKGELQPEVTNISSVQLLKETVYYLSHHSNSQSKNIFIDESAEPVIILTAEVLLKRVLINMLKNALDASKKGEDVCLNCKKDGDDFVIFTVHNNAYMPDNVQAQIFQRSFSTKGEGHGLGTYSMKLLTERYLNGKVGFTSSPEKGTEFFVRIPRK
ncbi:alkaline phosphatase synthesis sensor protein PhoR [mine drainage metagenome]|uniref:histidine kinase n=1 Tax=mine drainage metagenome TaxID=410659 RepID=A0A1J5SEJ8_9ZZZZ